MRIDIDYIEKAYLYLKGMVYHENLNFFLKQRIADFEFKNTEINEIFESELEDNNLDRVFESIAFIINSNEPYTDKKVQKWLENINYDLLPKNVDLQEKRRNKKNKGLFISNIKESEEYLISKLNYFINAPIEIHIIDTLWCLVVGSALEKNMSKDSYGNRMHSSALKNATKTDGITGSGLFKRYINQYDKWRDQAVSVATEIAKEGNDVAFLSIDIKSYYYSVDLNLDKIIEVTNTHYHNDPEKRALAFKLNMLLKQVYEQYREVTNVKFKQTHSEYIENKFLPIGLASSSIIANWYLSDFDCRVECNVRPVYYGRYVDDIIMVFKISDCSEFDTSDDPIKLFIDHYLKDIVNEDEKLGYVISVEDKLLPLQEDKLILQFFDKNHSHASLDFFKRKIDEQSSAFKFLPNEDVDKKFYAFAHNTVHSQCSDKVISIIGLKDNQTDLSKYLSNQIIAHKLGKPDEADEVLAQIEDFFKGVNALQFFRLWEKIYQYAIITKRYSFVKSFYNYIEDQILKISVSSPNNEYTLKGLSEEIQFDLSFYNRISLSITLGLLGSSDILKIHESICSLYKNNDDEIYRLSTVFRKSNMIRHHLVAWPLANFIKNISIDLTNENSFLKIKDIELDNFKIKYSPRFIHLDEWQVFELVKSLNLEGVLNKWVQNTIDGYKSRFPKNNIPVKYENLNRTELCINRYNLDVNSIDSKENIVLAIANMKLPEEYIGAAVRRDQQPNLSSQRQASLFSILNSSIIEKTDLLVMPEVAIPVSWLPFMISFSRTHQIGLVFGLEHWVIKNTAYNLIIEALPFRTMDNNKSCVMTARVKNHYAPAEIELLESLRLTPANLSFQPEAFYHKVSWRGMVFATYNCFELSDITHRSLFKSEIDLLVACVWNKDTNYYQHILESTVRDVHCYTVQANTSQYGGSCVLQPTKTVIKTMLSVKGGENSCILTTKLDIKKLRDFQYKSKPNSKDSFKHLPPGYNHDAVLSR
tara:strand:+ start:1915 stop:4872 length:2958 start_codon:yes stop_codon:yes gene_type:complete